jgi:hypothetical protein
MVTMRSQIAERRAKIVPHTNAQHKKKMKKRSQIAERRAKIVPHTNATEKKTGKKTDNKDNETEDSKDWGNFVQIQEFFLLKKVFTVLWSYNKVPEHGMTVVLQDWPTQALDVLFALNLYNCEVKKWIPKSRIVKQFVKESGKPWDTWVQIGNKIGMEQGYWDPLKYWPVRIHVVHKDSED